MKNLYTTIWIILIFCLPVRAQYVLRVQKQVLFDVLKTRELEKVVPKQDSLIASLRTSVSGLEGTVSSLLVLNTDYQNQISLLKQINFDSNEQIIILNKDKRRLKRQNLLLKILIPVAVAGTIYLCNH